MNAREAAEKIIGVCGPESSAMWNLCESNECERRCVMELWIARDLDGTLSLFTVEPYFDEDEGWWMDEGIETEDCLARHLFPDIKPGECRKFTEAKDDSI